MRPASVPEGELHAIDVSAGELDIGREATTPNESPQSLRPHPAAEIFPMMAEADIAALADNIKKNGLLEPIVLFNKLLADGRSRLAACLLAGVEPRFVDWDGVGTVEDFVLAKNLHRRHLNESQRAMVAARIAIYRHGGDRRSDQAANLPLGFSHKKAAEKTNISERSVRTAATVLAKGDPALVAAVDRGAIKVSVAAELIDLPKDRQRELATAGRYLVSKTVKRIRKTEETRKARADAKKVAVINPPEVASLPLATADRSQIVLDPDFQAEAEAASRDLEIERDERIALSGGTELATENDKLHKQNALLNRRINTLTNENRSLKYREKLWKERAKAAGWKGREDA